MSNRPDSASKGHLIDLAIGDDRSSQVSTRPQIGNILKAQLSPEEIQALIKKGYADALKTQEDFHLLEGGEQPPDFDRVLRTFTPEMLLAARDFQGPGLVLTTKGRSFGELIKAISDNKTLSNPGSTYVDSIFQKNSTQIIEHWGAHIVEGADHMNAHDFDNTELNLRGRLTEFAKYKKMAGVDGMNRWIYIHLMMQALREGKPIDAGFWTMLDEDPVLEDTTLSDRYVPVAGWVPGGGLYFFWGPPGSHNVIDQLRRSVGGIVPEA